jgi:hypothetical protein
VNMRLLWLALVLGLISTASSCGANVPGPIQVPADTSSITGAVVEVGDPVSMSVVNISRWPGGTPIEFAEIEPTTRPKGLLILGYQVVQTKGQGAVGAIPGFPPQGFTTLPFAGYRWSREAGPVQVVVGLQLTRKGNVSIPGFVLTYTQGGHTYGVNFHQGVEVCTAQRNLDGCTE